MTAHGFHSGISAYATASIKALRSCCVLPGAHALVRAVISRSSELSLSASVAADRLPIRLMNSIRSCDVTDCSPFCPSAALFSRAASIAMHLAPFVAVGKQHDGARRRDVDFPTQEFGAPYVG